MRMSFDVRIVEGRKSIRRKDMFMYVSSWYEALKLILHDSGVTWIDVKYKHNNNK